MKKEGKFTKKRIKKERDKNIRNMIVIIIFL